MTIYQFPEAHALSDADEEALPQFYAGVQHLIRTNQVRDRDTIDVTQIIGREGTPFAKMVDGHVATLPPEASHKFYRLKWYSASRRLVIYLTNSAGEYPTHR
jgi:hypothetical protein